MKKVQVWGCKIIVDDSVELPPGFNGPPRWAAIRAFEEAGIEVLGAFSGRGSLTKGEQEVFEAGSEVETCVEN